MDDVPSLREWVLQKMAAFHEEDGFFVIVTQGKKLILENQVILTFFEYSQNRRLWCPKLALWVARRR